MKKILILISIIVSLNIIACSDDDGSKADLRWKNKTSAVKDIKWVNSDGKTDQLWSGPWDSDSTTDYKGIDALAGTGECISEGNAAIIEFDLYDYEGVECISQNSATIKENATATLVISKIAKKK